MFNCCKCHLPIDDLSDAARLHAETCDVDECGCSTYIHGDCLGTPDEDESPPTVLIEHMLEVLHPDERLAIAATVIGAHAMAMTCPLVEAVHAVSRYEAHVTLRSGATIAEAQHWMRMNRSVGVHFAAHWMVQPGEPPEVPVARWYLVLPEKR